MWTNLKVKNDGCALVRMFSPLTEGVTNDYSQTNIISLSAFCSRGINKCCKQKIYSRISAFKTNCSEQ